MSRDEESDIARLLRAAGARENPSEEAARSVRDAVHAEWRATVKAHRQRRTRRAFLLAASVAGATVAFWVGQEALRADAPVVATVMRSESGVQVRGGALQFWKALASEAPVHAGDVVRTGAAARVAMTFPDGLSLRLDHDTRVAIVGEDRVRLIDGAVYVDSGAEGRASGELVVHTPYGTVEHVGTQYEARVGDVGLRVSVREGRVAVMPEEGASRTIRVGEQLFVAESGQVEHGSIAPSDAAWNWAASIAPAFAVDGRPVHEFLAWVARETGREVVFATPETEAEAGSEVLSGSIVGLTPDAALDAVLPTAGLRSELRDGQIVVSRQ